MVSSVIARRLAVVGAAALAVGLLAGCTPTPTVLPDVVVQQEGSTDFESNEFVVAIRAQELAQALAWNSSDFSIDELTESMSADEINDLYEFYAARIRRDLPPTAYAGPPIWAPVSVTQNGDTAEIVACLATQDRVVEAGSPETSYDLEAGSLRTWTYTLTDGIAVKDPKGASGDECDASAAQVVAFDPVPTVPEGITEGSIRKPAGQ